MKIYTNNIFRSFFTIAFILSVFVCSHAQSKKTKQPRWNWQKYEAEAIDYAKKYLISNLDPKLPQKSFEEWFQSLFDDSAQIDWQVNDCGEQSGTRADRGRDFPMCVSAGTQTGEFFYISVNIQFGMFSDGISREKSVLRHIMVGDQLDGEMFYVLSDLPEKIKSNRIKRQYLDPNNGVFVISGAKPAGFKDFTAMRLQTIAENKNFKRVAVLQNGKIEIGQKEYAMRKIRFDGKNWTFETVKVDGVSYQFAGKFAKHIVRTYGAGDADNKAVQGHLIKFVNGKKAAEADLFFNFYELGDAG